MLRAGRARRTARSPRLDDERGESLIETLISIMLLGLAVTGVLMAIGTGVRASVVHRRVATLEVAARNVSESLLDATYVRCATTASYRSAATDVVPTGFTVSITSLTYWVPASSPTSFTAPGAACATDPGLQRISFDVASTSGAGPTRSVSILKQDPGTLPASTDEVGLPINTVRCTISGASVADASIDQNQPTTNTGTATTMHLVERSGSARRSLLRFDLLAGSTPCTGPGEPSTLPAGRTIKQATLKLYTSSVPSSATCPSACMHALERIDTGAAGAWTEAGVTWNDQPSTRGAGITFSHGSSQTAAAQQISGNGLLDDVRAFYATPAVNHGWMIKEACPATYAGTTCTATAPGFALRTHEWTTPSEQPALVLVLGADIRNGKQIRNPDIGICASVKDDQRTSGGTVVSMPCDAGGYQAWTYDTVAKTLKGSNSANCLAPVATSGAVATSVVTCSSATTQRWTFEGAAIKDSAGRCLEVLGANPYFGTALYVSPTCDGSAKQRWSYEPVQASTPLPPTPMRVRNVRYNNCLDIRDGYTDPTNKDNLNRPGESFPCLGGSRASQNWTRVTATAFGNSAAAAGTTCLDANGGVAGSKVQVVECAPTKSWNQWDFQSGVMRNLQYGLCLQGTVDIGEPSLQVCNPSLAEQRWVVEPATSPSTLVTRQIRNQASNQCLEPIAGTTSIANGTYLWSWPCLGSTRTMQSFSLFSNGQVRLTANLGYCVDSTTNNSPGQRLDLWPCNNGNRPTPGTNQGYTWPAVNIAGDWKNLANASVCIRETPDDSVNGTVGDLPVLRTCVTGADANYPRQRWVFEPVGTVSQNVNQVRNALGSCLEPAGASSQSGTTQQVWSWPCTGPSRAKQSFLLLSNGQLRSAATPTSCLEVGSVAATQVPYLAPCATGSTSGTTGGRQRWRIQQVGTAADGAPINQIQHLLNTRLCLQSGRDTDFATLQTCGDTSSQQFVLEGPGATVSTHAGQVRSTAATDCIDINGPVANGTAVWGWPCLADDAPTQQWLLLNNGQLRSAVNDRFCLDANNTAVVGERVQVWTCYDSYGTNKNQVWDADTTAFTLNGSVLRNQRYSPGLCALSTGDAGGLTVQNCNGAPMQGWTFEPFGTTSQKVGQLRNSLWAGCAEPRDGANGEFASWPCSGAARPQQRLVRLSTGQIRKAGDSSRCLDVGSVAAGQRPRWTLCTGTTAARSTWLVRNDGLVQADPNGAANLCLAGGQDLEYLALASCDTSAAAAQRWTFEAAGSTVTTKVRELRNVQYDNCTDFSGTIANGLTPRVLPCLGLARAPRQAFLVLNNGQIRLLDDLTYCLDANGGDGAAGRSVLIWSCADQGPNPRTAPAVPWQLWDLVGGAYQDPYTIAAGSLQPRKADSTVSPQVRRCQEGSDDTGGQYGRACSGLDAQRWYLEPIAP